MVGHWQPGCRTCSSYGLHKHWIGFDKSDHMSAYSCHSLQRGSAKWWKNVLLHFFYPCLVNAHILHNKRNRKTSYLSCYTRWLLKAYSVVHGKMRGNEQGVLLQEDLLEKSIYHTNLQQHMQSCQSQQTCEVCADMGSTKQEKLEAFSCVLAEVWCGALLRGVLQKLQLKNK
jgi:hypothetical protein